MRLSIRIVASAMMAGLAAVVAWAGSETKAPATKPVRQGPLAALPSLPGATIEKIKALGDNEWLNLGEPAADPTWGRARGRSWSSKMSYAADLGGAFLYGQGIHGYIKPDGRFMDDLWFYDLNANRWICLYPGTDTKNFIANIKKGELKVNDEGQLVDKDGQPVPFSAISGHSYQAHAYDPDHHRFLIAGGGTGVGSEQHVRDQEWCKTGRELLLAQGKTDKVVGTPYVVNALNGRFERDAANGTKMPNYDAGSYLYYVAQYLPTRKTFWIYGGNREARPDSGATVTCDPVTRQCSNLGAKGAAPTGVDFGACYDSKRDRVYVGGGSYGAPHGKDEGFVYTYDVKTNTWSTAPNKPNAMGWPGTNRCCVHYDATADRVLCFFGWNGPERGKDMGISVYDPESAAWDAPLSTPPAVLAGCVNAFYSPEVNAHFFYVAGDGNDHGAMWAYRYKRAAKTQ